MNPTNETIVFMDTNNQEIDVKYALKLIAECRQQLGWQVKEGTKIYNDLIEFSKGYSKSKRDVREVFTIFCIATGIMTVGKH